MQQEIGFNPISIYEVFDRYSQPDNKVIKEISPNLFKKTTKLYSTPKDSIAIALTGESASGKSTLAEQLIKEISSEQEKYTKKLLTMIEVDNYFKSFPTDNNNVPKSFLQLLSEKFDFDAPNRFQMDLLAQDLKKLLNNEQVKIPFFNNPRNISIPNSIDKKPAKVIFMEGIASFYDEVRNLFDLKIYMEADENVRTNRFRSRAENYIKQHNKLEELPYIDKQITLIKESAKKHIIPNRKHADIIINGNMSKEAISKFVVDICKVIFK